MPRAFVLVMDSLGIGASADAATFGDAGANTLGHIAEARAAAGAMLSLPHLARLGLGLAAEISTRRIPAGLATGDAGSAGAYGAAREVSCGKDTPSGHWEMAGVPVTKDWGYFPRLQPCFPAELIEQLIARAGIPGVLGNKHASGTEILDEEGEAHIRSGRPIVYTSADSVFQIAAHEAHFGLQALYDLCQIARQLVDAYDIAGSSPGPSWAGRADRSPAPATGATMPRHRRPRPCWNATWMAAAR